MSIGVVVEKIDEISMLLSVVHKSTQSINSG